MMKPKLEQIPVKQLVWNRLPHDNLELLVDEIRENGYRQDTFGIIDVFKLSAYYLILHGNTRAHAAKMLDIKTIPAYVYDNLSEIEILEASMDSYREPPPAPMTDDEIIAVMRLMRSRNIPLSKAFSAYKIKKFKDRL